MNDNSPEKPGRTPDEKAPSPGAEPGPPTQPDPDNAESGAGEDAPDHREGQPAETADVPRPSTPEAPSGLEEMTFHPDSPGPELLFVQTMPDKPGEDVLEILAQRRINPVRRFDKSNASKSFEQLFTEHPRIRFAVFILTGDDFVYPKEAKSGSAKLRAPQPFVFALGYMMAKLGRQNVFILSQEQKSLLLPTPLHHALYTSYDAKGLWRKELSDRLGKAGFPS